MPFVDFGALKERVAIDQAAQMLGLKLTAAGNQLRGPCPACQSGGDRALVITPEKGLFYCFGARTGGDCIALVAHIKGVGNKQAADQLAERFGTVQDSTRTVTSTVSKQRATVPPAPSSNEKELQPLQYLEASHPKVQELGVSPETAAMFGAGYAPKGVLRGRLAVPVKSRDGKLLAYCGIAVDKEQSPRLVFHNFDPHTALFNAERLAEGGDLFICRDPLCVLQAVENGIAPESLVSVLTDGITAVQFEMLASLLDQKHIEHAQFF